VVEVRRSQDDLDPVSGTNEEVIVGCTARVLGRRIQTERPNRDATEGDRKTDASSAVRACTPRRTGVRHDLNETMDARANWVN